MINSTRILAIDYGERNIGVAFTESDIATPIASFKIKTLDDVTKHLSPIIEEYDPELIVIGIPNSNQRKIKEFATYIHDHFKIEYKLHPETLSTKEAISKLREIGANRSKLKHDHKYSACIILEDYINSKHECV